MSLSAAQIATFRKHGHLTVPGVFEAAEMRRAIADLEQWGAEFLGHLPPEQRVWYVDAGVTAREVLRKLDNPVAHRPMFRALAADPRLIAMAHDLIGGGLTACFSQVFFKPPEGGGPKPMHQDNYYFGPDDPDGLVTAWIALDDATVENGCMWFGDGSHRGLILPHFAPPGEPFNLQIPDEIARLQAMSAAPVPCGGVSFHHGTTLHQSGPNRSQRWRRACAIHYVNEKTVFATPALPYDHDLFVRID